MAVRASEMKYEIAPEGARDYAPLLGIFGLVAYVYNRATLNAPQLLKFVAWYQVLVAAIAVRTLPGRCNAGGMAHLQSTAARRTCRAQRHATHNRELRAWHMRKQHLARHACRPCRQRTWLFRTSSTCWQLVPGCAPAHSLGPESSAVDPPAAAVPAR